MVRTRGRESSTSRDGESERDETSNLSTSSAAASHSLPQSRPEFERKFLIMDSGSLAGDLTVFPWPHPRHVNSTPLFAISSDNGQLFEMVDVDGGGPVARSMLVHDENRTSSYLVAEAPLHALAPLHPLIIAIPALLQGAQTGMHTLDELLERNCVSKQMARRLAESPTLLNALKLACTTKQVDGELYVRWDEEKAIAWLAARHERLKGALVKHHATMHDAVRSDDKTLSRYAFGILADWLPEQLTTRLRTHLGLPEDKTSDAEPKDHSVMKRRSSPPASEIPLKKPLAPAQPSATAAQKRLLQASKGTMSLASFFGKKA